LETEINRFKLLIFIDRDKKNKFADWQVINPLIRCQMD